MRTTDAQQHYRRAIGLFSTRQEAEDALYRLRDTGFNMDHISIVAKSGAGLKDLTGNDYDPSTSGREQAKGSFGAGATAGAIAGGAIGLIGSLGVLAIPGVGVAAEVGFLLGDTLLGSGIGAVGGGLIGALLDWDVPEEKASHYNHRVYNENDFLVMVEGTEAEIRAAESVLRESSIRDWGVYGSAPKPSHTPNR